MNDFLIALSLLGGIFILLYVIYNLASYMTNRELYQKKYQELQRGVYRYNGSHLDLIYFNLYTYDIASCTFHPTNCNIIFFPDGSVKLTENLYIHKSHWFWSLYSWYYLGKFQRLKDYHIQSHNFREAYRRMDGNHYERYMKQQIKKDFKFLRG